MTDRNDTAEGLLQEWREWYATGKSYRNDALFDRTRAYIDRQQAQGPDDVPNDSVRDTEPVKRGDA